MRWTVWTSASLLVLSGCGGSPEAVGENSAGSIKTTAVGEVVANAATPTPTPTPTADAAAATTNTTDAATDAAADAPEPADDTATAH